MNLADQLHAIADQLPPPNETVETLLAAAVETNDRLLLEIEQLTMQRDGALTKARNVDQENVNLRLAIARIAREFTVATTATAPKGTVK